MLQSYFNNYFNKILDLSFFYDNEMKVFDQTWILDGFIFESPISIKVFSTPIFDNCRVVPIINNSVVESL